METKWTVRRTDSEAERYLKDYFLWKPRRSFTGSIERDRDLNSTWPAKVPQSATPETAAFTFAGSFPGFPVEGL